MPRVGLNTEKLVAAAARLANQRGWSGLTLKDLARELGVRPPSLYKHIASLEDLGDKMAIQGTRQLTEILRRRLAGVSGKRALKILASEYRRFAKEQPGLYATTQATHVNRSSEYQAEARELLALVFQVIAGAGVPEVEVVHFTRALRAAIHGFVDLEFKGGFGLKEDTEQSFDYLVEKVIAYGVGSDEMSQEPERK